MIRVGTSGWCYKDWSGPFYPEGLKAKDRLNFYASRFTTAEINASFYRLPTEAAVASWAAGAPEGFVFAWKASRFITHNKKLKDVAASLELVFGRMDGLGRTFGPVLFQLPPQLRRNDERLATFLEQLPRHRRVTVEFRHPSWYEPAVFDLLRDARRGPVHLRPCCGARRRGRSPPRSSTCADTGRPGVTSAAIEEPQLQGWADFLARALPGDAYAYFDNDIKSAAPADAARLIEMLVERGSNRVLRA